MDYADIITGVVVPILIALVTGLLVWIWALWSKQTADKEALIQLHTTESTAIRDKVSALALEMASGYHNKEELRQMLVELLTPLRDDMRALKDEVRSQRNGHAR